MKSEFINTNNWGGYTSSTFLYGNTRKYHGLLVVGKENLDRYVVVSALEEKLVIDNSELFLSNIQFDQELTPNKFIQSYSPNPFPVVDFQLPNIQVHKIQRAIKNSNRIEIIYEFESSNEIQFSVSPLLTYRNTNSIVNKLDSSELNIKSYENYVEYSYPENAKLIVRANDFEFDNSLDSYANVHYESEKNRGYEYKEDLIKAGTYNFQFKPGTSIVRLVVEFEHSYQPREHIISGFREKDISNLDSYLQSKLDDFVVATGKDYSLIAGYHWFGEWGRDTFISFRGALLLTNKVEVARDILLSWANKIVNGLIPNRPDKKEFNNIDGSLWFVIACYQYFTQTKDYLTLRKLYPKIYQIVDCYTKGTDFGIKENANGYVQFDSKYNLTWMDAVVEGRSATPRLSCAVEVQMLWYNSLIILSLFEQFFGELDNSILLKQRAVKLRENFQRDFLTDEYIADSIEGLSKITEVRPNVVVGLSLPFNILTKDQSKIILNVVQSELLTAGGLRTLSYKDKKYIGEYGGDEKSRDLAYHNGTVWPYLLGLYLKATIKIYGNEINNKKYILNAIEDLKVLLKSKDLEYIPEVFSGNSLTPNGTLTQLWNYATLYEVLHDINLSN